MAENQKQTFIPEFEAYIRATEPDIRERADVWRTAIGLQQVDGLTVSDYLKQTAKRNIEGEITIDETEQLVKTYYQSKAQRQPDDSGKEEADRVSTNIARILGEPSFTFSVAGLANIHRQIFAGVFSHAGQFRQYDITKKEWVLRGDTVLYSHWEDLSATIAYDLEQEKCFNYTPLNRNQTVEHIASFVSGLWQIHPFEEGNTRTIAIFTIKYLRSIGFVQINNALFEQHSWFFRNALVRANYRNVQEGVNPDISFLTAFFRNLLYGEQHPLHNRYMHIAWRADSTKEDGKNKQVPNKYRTSTEQVNCAENENVMLVVRCLGRNRLSQKELMGKVGLRHRPTFIENYISPSINSGYVRLLYPDSPRHPRQKYLLTVKGLGLYNELTK